MLQRSAKSMAYCARLTGLLSSAKPSPRLAVYWNLLSDGRPSGVERVMLSPPLGANWMTVTENGKLELILISIMTVIYIRNQELIRK